MINQAQIILRNEDRLQVMRSYPDKYFDLAIPDFEYGIGEDGESNHSRGGLAEATKFTPKAWDREPPPQEVFDELFRISKHQIIWGGNYFIDKIKKPSAGWIIWDKVNGNTHQSDCELAWTSFDMGARIFRFMWAGMRQGKNIDQGYIMQGNKKMNEKRRHPCQKPRALYRWLYQKFAEKHFRVFDPGFGSGNSAIEAYCFGVAEYVGCEIDEEYYSDAVAELEAAREPLPVFKH
ncbi:DNA methyltransferase [Pontibacter rugosus]|uniref:Methyltransferase n=1 Tax=Pontibacter rugosus TaxID=1745966 RepID=A0ABW3SJ87_9BACT